MKKTLIKDYCIVWAISVFYGIIIIPIDFMISIKSTSIGFVLAVLLAFRSCGLIMVIVSILTTIVFILLKTLDRLKHRVINTSLQQALLITPGVFVIIFFLLFDRYYNKFEVLVAVEIIGGAVSIIVGCIFYVLLQSENRSNRLTAICPKVSVIGTLVIVIMLGIYFIGVRSTTVSKGLGNGSGKSDRPNILLIVMDTVRSDHLSLYGYHWKTTPFLEIMAKESAVFNNAYATAPWTLPSHASLFTGLYPSQHNTHAEHFWLDDSYRTLAEQLRDAGYQTISFSNNDYVSSYHNLTQGFERSWYKTRWTDDVTQLSPHLGRSVVSFFSWFWDRIQTGILAKTIRNPSSIYDYPTAAETNKDISEWLDNGRDESRPFFIFINYMDAHLPYNPNDETARMFLNDEELKISYKQKYRNPPIEHCLDISKAGYNETDIRIISSLYDACIRYLDRNLENLMKKFKRLGIYDNTLIIITSDHGEYLGTRNRLAHGLGLHDDLLHVPLIARYPTLFDAGARYDTIVSLIDIPATILSFAKINEDHEGMSAVQLLYDLKENFRSNIFGEFRFPLHLMVNASLLEDNSNLFVEEKTIHNQIHQLIWKSRGKYEMYNIVQDPLQINNIYLKDNEKFAIMNQHLLNWRKSLRYISAPPPKLIDFSQKENLELMERLRGIGYMK